MLFLFSEFLVSGDDTVVSTALGTHRDANNCVTDGGYQWCEKTQSCERPWIKPCSDELISGCPEMMCMLSCDNGYHKDASGCQMCQCKTSNPTCDIPYTDCGMKTVCPRTTEITSCGLGGLKGYTTYRLSLVIKDPRVNSLYIIYGTKKNVMYIPAAYQVKHLGSDIGGVNPKTINMDPRLKYDSWLSLGHVDGSLSAVRAIGIDFTKWDAETPLKTNDGAIFSMDPTKPVVSGKEIVIAQITIPTDTVDTMIINVQGNYKDVSRTPWAQEDIEFILKTPKIVNQIPKDCVSWNDGCNTCVVKNGVLGVCTRMMCFIRGTPHCATYGSGH